VREEVWDLYRLAIETHGPVPTLVEWDDHLPSFDRVVDEARRARQVADAVGAPAAASREGRGGLAV
jgi:uncharacterized protein (UPF0276 family)